MSLLLSIDGDGGHSGSHGGVVMVVSSIWVMRWWSHHQCWWWVVRGCHCGLLSIDSGGNCGVAQCHCPGRGHCDVVVIVIVNG